MSVSGSESQFHIVIRHPDTTTRTVEEGACCYIATLMGMGETLSCFNTQHSHHKGPATRVAGPRPGLTHKYQYRSQSSLQLTAAARSSAGFIEFFVLESNIFGPHKNWCRLVRPSVVTGVGGNYESWLIATFIIAAEFSLILPAAGTYPAPLWVSEQEAGQSAHFKYLWFALKSYQRLHSSLPLQSVSILVIRWLLLKASF